MWYSLVIRRMMGAIARTWWEQEGKPITMITSDKGNGGGSGRTQVYGSIEVEVDPLVSQGRIDDYSSPRFQDLPEVSSVYQWWDVGLDSAHTNSHDENGNMRSVGVLEGRRNGSTSENYVTNQHCVRATLPPSTLFADRALLRRGYSISEPNVEWRFGLMPVRTSTGYRLLASWCRRHFLATRWSGYPYLSHMCSVPDYDVVIDAWP